MNEHTSVFFRFCHHPQRFQIRVLLIAGFKFLVIDPVCLGKSLLDIAAAVMVVKEGLFCFSKVNDRFQLFIVNSACVTQLFYLFLVRAAQHGDRFAEVFNGIPAVDRGIIQHDFDIIVSRYVFRIHIEVTLREFRHMNLQHFGARHF